MRKFIDKKIAIFALFAMLIQVLVTKFVYPVFGTTTQNLYSITPTGALTSQTIGNKFIGILSGIIDFNLGNFTVWISMFIGAYLLAFVGLWIYDQKWAWRGKTETGRLWAIFLYGSLGLWAVLFVTNWIGATSIDIASLSVALLIGVAINYVVVAGIYVFFATKVKATKFLRI